MDLRKEAEFSSRNVPNSSSTSSVQNIIVKETQEIMASKNDNKCGLKARTKVTAALTSRPLSAYNIFFKVQRYLIITGKPNELDIKTIHEIASTPNFRGKRIHRKSHGKIGFSELAKEISQRWKTCDKNVKVHFKELARKDRARYDQENKTIENTQSSAMDKDRKISQVESLSEISGQSNSALSEERAENSVFCNIEPLPLANSEKSAILDKCTCDYLLSALSGSYN